jgi:hypothetical protein
MSIYSATTAWRDFLVSNAKDAAQAGDYSTPSWAGGNGPKDSDFDGVPNGEDNCPDTENPNQSDMDDDGKGDACDSDIDGDGVKNPSDNCGKTPNPSQKDSDNDFIGDACDSDSDQESDPENPNPPENPDPTEEEDPTDDPRDGKTEDDGSAQPDGTGGPVVVVKDGNSGGGCSTAGQNTPINTRAIFLIGLLGFAFLRPRNN